MTVFSAISQESPLPVVIYIVTQKLVNSSAYSLTTIFSMPQVKASIAKNMPMISRRFSNSQQRLCEEYASNGG